MIETLRQEENKTPTIMLTAKGAEEDRVRGLELGADDYVTKPFAIAELVARVAAQVRRARMDRGDGEIFEADGLRFDLGRLTATRGEEVLHLTPREGEILSHLPAEARKRRHARRVPARGLEVPDGERADAHRRQHAGRAAPEDRARSRGAAIVETVRGKGYRWGGDTT